MAAAWMMQHVFDHWDYSRDVGWLQKQGYNLVREAAGFWTTQLTRDKFTGDNTLVVNPCNSPERDPTTFGCANWQQLLHQLFTQALLLADAVNDGDPSFTSSLQAYLLAIDKGIHFTSWGGLKEFKLPESVGLEKQGDQRKHLSHLVGWFPGYSISSFSGGYQNRTIQRAIAASLKSRGNGYADGNTGWAKIWRAAAWARLNNTEQADHQLRFSIFSNIGPNGLGVYDGKDGPFQIDTNFGIAGAMLSMLIVDLPQTWPKTGKRTVVLGPAIPSRWGPGSLKGLRIRGGTVLDLNWNNKGVVDKVSVVKKGEGCKFYSKEGKLIGEI
jgi:alpha-L-fucosidase 2